MSNQLAAWQKRTVLVWVAVASLVLATVMPLLVSSNLANAAQVQDRYIHMGSGAPSASDTSYEISIQFPNGAVVDYIRVEFCDEDPLPGEACNSTTVEGTTVPSLDADTGSAITVGDFAFADTPSLDANGDPDANGYLEDATPACDQAALTLATTHTAGTNLNYLDIDCDAAQTVVAGGGATDTDYLNIQIDGVDNPSSLGSFYARVYTSDSGTMGAYSSGGAPIDATGGYEGGVALSTAQQITVTARVQEQLTFSVGADAQEDDCNTFVGTTVDLGVLDSTNINYASLDPNASTDDVACLEVTTNAANGVNVYYIGDNLAQGACTGSSDTENATPDESDNCINSDLDGSDLDNNTTSASPDIAGGTEQWGLSVIDDDLNTNLAGGLATTNLGHTTEYDGDTNSPDNPGTDDAWTFIANTADVICSSNSVVNAEICQVDAAGAAAITTPTGVYTTTLTFIATATF